VPRRLKPGGLIECADMEMHFRRAFAFARQGGPAPRAESAPPAGRRVELLYLPFGHSISVTAECHEHGDRRTAMLATALAMAPRHPYRFTAGDKSHRAAQASALNSVAHLVIVPLPRDRGHSVDQVMRPSGHCLNRQAGGLPLGKPVFEPTHIETMRALGRHCFERQNAIGASAIGNDLSPPSRAASDPRHRSTTLPLRRYIRETDSEGRLECAVCRIIP